MACKPFVTGRCLRGAVSSTIHGDSIGSGQCHCQDCQDCQDCQRASGTGHMSLARLRREDVELHGQTSSYASTAGSGNINTRHFCSLCGSRVYGKNSAAPGILNISVGCMDDNGWFAPGRVVYAKDRPKWTSRQRTFRTSIGCRRPFRRLLNHNQAA